MNIHHAATIGQPNCRRCPLRPDGANDLPAFSSRLLSRSLFHMLKPHELFAQMPPAVAEELFGFIAQNETALYKGTIDTLAKQRKLRPIFIERKPRAERHVWMRDVVGRKVNESVAAHLLQIWLVRAHSKLLCDFLDGLGIAHDENGTIDQLPPAPEKAQLVSVIDDLLTKHDPAVVVVYLHAFQALDDAGWSTLAELLAQDARLKL